MLKSLVPFPPDSLGLDLATKATSGWSTKPHLRPWSRTFAALQFDNLALRDHHALRDNGGRAWALVMDRFNRLITRDELRMSDVELKLRMNVASWGYVLIRSCLDSKSTHHVLWYAGSRTKVDRKSYQSG